MEALRRILIATDLSKYAKNALKRAKQLSIQHQSALFGIYVIWNDWIDSIYSLVSAAERKNLQLFKKNIKKQFIDEIESSHPFPKKVDFTIKSGREYVEISKYAQTKKVDLIVLGAHGEHYLDDLILGSTAENVIKHVNVPVLLVQQKPNFEYKRLLVTIDFSPISRDTFHSACHFFPDAKIELLFVADLWHSQKNPLGGTKRKSGKKLTKMIRSELLDKMNRFVSECHMPKSKVKTTLLEGFPPLMISNHVNQSNFDLLVIGTRGHSLMQYLLLGSVTKKILQLVEKDILIIPPGISP